MVPIRPATAQSIGIKLTQDLFLQYFQSLSNDLALVSLKKSEITETPSPNEWVKIKDITEDLVKACTSEYS